MGGVYRSSHVEVNVRCLFKQKSAYERCTVLLKIPLLVKLIVAKVILGILNDLVHCDHALCYKVNSFDLRDRRHVTSLKAEAYLNLLAKIFCRNR